MSDVAVRLEIRGRVQGVWYRGWTVEQATHRSLRGWVRNRTDHSVEALFIGPAAVVDDMIDACHKGPPSAHVMSLRRFDATDDGSAGFVQRPTE